MTSCYHNGRSGPESKMMRMFHQVRQVAVPEAKSAVSDYILCYGYFLCVLYMCAEWDVKS